MKKQITVLLAALLLIAALVSPADATVRINASSLNGTAIHNGTMYVPLRAAAQLLSPGCSIRWNSGTATVETDSLSLTARPGDLYIQANGRMLYVPQGVKLSGGTLLIPIRALARAFGISADWEASSRSALLTGSTGAITPGSQYYDADEILWLARIIHAESQGEPLTGKIAVGNVVLNRVASPDFPDTLYEVIFDETYAVQFQPVVNGTIYDSPGAESVLAAKLCLDGANVAGSCLYFLNPAIATSSWITENRSFYATVGNHDFYL